MLIRERLPAWAPGHKPPPSRLARRDTALLMGALAVLLSFTPSMLKRRKRDQATLSVLAAGLGAGAGLATEELVVRLTQRFEGSETTARAVIVLLGVTSAGLRLPAHPRSAVAAVGTGAGVAATAAVLGAIAPERRWGRVQVRTLAGGALSVGGVVMLVVRRRRAATKGSKAARPRMKHYPIDAYLPTVSGGEGSLLPLDALDFEGSRFLAGAVPADEIRALRGATTLPVMDPIRVFAGLKSAGSPRERARLAVEELERLGGFSRGRIVVWSTTLRGFVNPVPMEAAEVYRRGDVASVAVQFWDRPTPFMPLKVPVATETQKELLLALRSRLVALGPDAPELVVYGESLGAWANQNVFRETGVEGLDDMRVSRALWVGTPALSRLRQRMERGRVPSDARVATLKTRELLEAEPAEVDTKRFFFLFRRADPVVAFSGLELIWRRPDWLPDEGGAFEAPGTRPQGVPRGQRWIPGITFLQVVVDLLRATRWTSDLPKAAAHDYRVELPLAVDVAFDDEISRPEAESLADKLVAREVARGTRLRALRRGEPDPGMPAVP